MVFKLDFPQRLICYETKKPSKTLYKFYKLFFFPLNIFDFVLHLPSSVDWGSRIYQLLLCWRVRPLTIECPGYYTKQSDGEVLVMLELCEMRSTPLLPLLPGPFWPGMRVPDRALPMNRIELSCVLMLNWIVWNRTVFCIKWIWHWITYKGWCALKPNQAKYLPSYQFLTLPPCSLSWRYAYMLRRDFIFYIFFFFSNIFF